MFVCVSCVSVVRYSKSLVKYVLVLVLEGGLWYILKMVGVVVRCVSSLLCVVVCVWWCVGVG